MRFEKWQALGNDYVIVERDALPWELTPERIRLHLRAPLGDRLGRDPALLCLRHPLAQARLRIFNPDGSEAELSGNGAREAALYLERADWETRDLILDPHQGGRGSRPTIPGRETATLDMGASLRHIARLPLRGAGRRRNG